MSTANELLIKSIEDTQHLYADKTFLVRYLFKCYEWNRRSKSNRLLLEILFINYVHTFKTHLGPNKKHLLDNSAIK